MEPRTVSEVRIVVPVQEERPSTCQHAHQRLSRCLRRQKSRLCSGWIRRQLPGGQRQGNSRPSGRSAVTAGTGRLRFAPFWRASRSSAQSDAGPQCWRVQSASGQLLSNWGGRPRRPAHRIGGRASRSMRWWASVSGSRGRSGLLATRRPRVRQLPHGIPERVRVAGNLSRYHE
jgi:hypothetical protein